MPYIDGPKRTFLAGGAIAQYARVKLSGSYTVIEAGAADTDIGTAETLVASGEEVDVRLANAQGTVYMIAGAAIAANASIYAAANGEISTVVSGPILGTALEAATAAGDIIEVLRT